MLLKMANAWADPSKRKKFDLIIIVMFVIIVGITVVVAGAMSWFGLAIMSFLYGIDFEQYRGLCFVMLAAGGVTAGIEFLYQVITVLRLRDGKLAEDTANVERMAARDLIW